MDILDKYLKEDQEIDFMDIDIEKFDEKVISRMDFSRYKPTIIMIENLVENEWGGVISNPVLLRAGYKMMAFTGRSAIYKK